MSGIIIFIIVIVVFVLFSFAKDSYKEKDKVVKEGGMRVKYKTLIDNFVSPSDGLRIVKETSNYVCVAMNNSSGKIVFHFQHTFNQINVIFEMKNLFLGEHKLEWDFPETMDQNEMIRQIETRTRQYMDNVTTNFT